MIIRIVQMTFREGQVESFLEFFEGRKSTIRNFDGCRHLELWQDAKDQNKFFTYSIWESELHLDRYRYSEFFKETWTTTKGFFGENAKAWSVIQNQIVS